MYSVTNHSPEAWKRLGEQIRRWRVRRGLTQQQLAEAAGVAVGTVRNLENGQRARMLTLPAISRALGWIEDSYVLVLEGGDPLVEDGVTEVPPDDALRVERPDGLTDDEWSEIKGRFIDDLQFWLRYRKRP